MEWFNTSLSADVEVVCKEERYLNNVQLYVVVFEQLVTPSGKGNGGLTYRNVVLDMVPTNGILLGNQWSYGKTENTSVDWDYLPFVEDKEELGLAVFVQDRSTGRVLQSAVEYKQELSVPVEPTTAIETFRIYPNPAHHSIYVERSSRSVKEGTLRLLDVNGRVVREIPVEPETRVLQMDLNHIIPGIYILQVSEDRRILTSAKIVKIR